MNSGSTSDFDFDTWRTLAETDPEAFETRRREEFDRLIAGAPAHIQPRLRGLQWRLDMDRRRHSHALGACVAAFSEMWKAVYGEHGLLSALNGLESGQADPADHAASTATVVEFRSRARLLG